MFTVWGMWKIGDRAYCIKKGPWQYVGTAGPEYGIVYLVTEVISEGRIAPKDRDGDFGLRLSGFEHLQTDGKEHCYSQSKFRKIVPKCDKVKAR